MRPKLTDVAKKAGVSPTTVSRVINNYGYLSQKTKDKVFAAMQELNYQPNLLARSLQGKDTKLIGLIFPQVTNPFFAELVESIEKNLFARGYKVILCNAGIDKHKEREYLKMLMANQVNGIIAGAHNLGIEEYHETGLPIVSFDRKLSDNIPIVSCDNYQGATLATEELYQAGCRHIYFLGNPIIKGNPTDQRLLGYKSVLAKYGLNEHFHTINFFDSTAIRALAIRQLLEKKSADGIVCTDDLAAILVLQEAAKLGIKVPEELKVTGFDGTKFIQDYHPELSTVQQPIADIASLLVNVLLERIANPKAPLQTDEYILPVTFIRKNSTCEYK